MHQSQPYRLKGWCQTIRAPRIGAPNAATASTVNIRQGSKVPPNHQSYRVVRWNASVSAISSSDRAHTDHHSRTTTRLPARPSMPSSTTGCSSVVLPPSSPFPLPVSWEQAPTRPG